VLPEAAIATALATFAPVVVHDDRENFPLTSVAAATVRVPGVAASGDRRPAVYARAAPADGDGTWLQYWLFYESQDQDRGIVRTGRHAGDWEMVQYRLDAGGRPAEAVYAQHSIAERCGWGTVEKRAGHPVVYPARGAHGSYFRAGARDRIFPDPNDEANGRGVVSRPRVVIVSESSPAWMRWDGHWGGARARIPGEQDSPRGPSHQPQGRWSDPDAWARAATSCRADCDSLDECDTTERAMGVGGGAAVLGLAALVVWRRRRRARPAR
jgi:MYXO-CTERM domain-containing protein